VSLVRAATWVDAAATTATAVLPGLAAGTGRAAGPGPASTLALVPLGSTGLVLAGCAACRLPLGLAGAPGLADALAAHTPTCPQRCPKRPTPRRHPTPAAAEVCPSCGCEAELHPRVGASGWRCGDCLAEALRDDLGIPASAPVPVPVAVAAGAGAARRGVRPAPVPTVGIAHAKRARRHQRRHQRRHRQAGGEPAQAVSRATVA
jgi:hypothetical protein